MVETTVHLLRHGEVENPEGIIYGRLPGYGLSETGMQMALAAARYFRSLADAGALFSHVTASPLMRAQQTAAPVAHALEVDLFTDEHLNEIGNRFEGMPVHPRTFLTWRHMLHLRNPFRPSWGEPYSHAVERMKEAIDVARRTALERQGPGAQVVLVSHQAPIWLVRQALTGKCLAHDPRKRTCTVGSVTTLRFTDERVADISYHEPALETEPAGERA